MRGLLIRDCCERCLDRAGFPALIKTVISKSGEYRFLCQSCYSEIHFIRTMEEKKL
jgi:hypothetical protein